MIDEFYCFYTENEVCSFAFGKAYNEFYNYIHYKTYGDVYLSVDNIVSELYKFTCHNFEVNNINRENIKKPGYNVEKDNNKWFFYVLSKDLKYIFYSRYFVNEIDLSAFVFGYIYSEYIKST